jgi:uncharacterized protein (DUF924 family)
MNAIVDFWFAGAPDSFRDAWFRRDDAFDAAIRAQLGALLHAAFAGTLPAVGGTAEDHLARVILLDQFPRNLHRGTAQAFALDSQARAAATDAIMLGHDAAVTPVQRLFFYLPFTHSEAIADQDRCVGLVAAMVTGRPDLDPCLESAHKHRAVIAQFGRFPHRNAALGRTNTPEETAYLARPNAGF